VGDRRALSTGVDWQPWSAAAFARARAEHKAVLLSIHASWCHWCHEMDRTSYADPDIVAFINESFVAVQVDADERPDVSERYSLGGWPTTAFLTADGDILTGGTFVPVERMHDVLSRVAEQFRTRHPELDRSGTPGLDRSGREGADRSGRAGLHAPPAVYGPPAIYAPPTPTALRDSVFASFDPAHGGFGVEPKFPLAAPIELALQLWEATHDERWRTIATRTLDAMGWGALYDEPDGGFFRYATTRDWQLPHCEKLLEVNAALLRVYLHGGRVLDAPRFTDRAADTLRYVQNTLADPVDGGWHASQEADPDYYALASEQRRTRAAPRVSNRLYADANAAMISAAIDAMRTFEDDGLGAFAQRSLERVLMACYKPGSGVAHRFDAQPRVRGLLADQIATATACLDVFELGGNIVYEMMAEELAHFVIRVMWDDATGGFFDRSIADPDEDVGLLRERLKPFATNCDAARMLTRLASSSGNHEFESFAERTLAAMVPYALEQGPLAAHYLLANSGPPR
jgi:uncharacterized protein